MYLTKDNIKLQGIDLYKNTLLLTTPCGYGKTTFAMTQLCDVLNEYLELWRDKEPTESKYKPIEPTDIYILEPRRIIKDQTIAKYGAQGVPQCDMCAFGEGEYNQPYIDTAHRIGVLLCENQVKRPRVIVVDEAHSAFTESEFAESLYYIEKYLENNEDIIKVFMTATNDIFINYFPKVPQIDDKFSFVEVCEKLPQKYKPKFIKLISGLTAETLTKYIEVAEDKKAFIFVRDAKTAKRLRDNTKNSAFLCSKENNLAEYMDEDVRDYLIQKKAFPQDVNIIFATSAYREGLDLLDENVKSIIIEAIDTITIIQSLGRLRQSNLEVYIVNNKTHFSQLETTIKETMDFVRRVEEIEDEQARQMVLEEHNKLQDADERKPKISIEYPYKSGKYEINYYAVAQLKQLYDCMISANELTDNTKLYLNGEEKPNCKEYIRNMLIDYVKSDDKIIFAFDEQFKNEYKIEQKISKYKNKRLYADDQDIMAFELNLYDKYKKPMKKTNVKRALIESGYQITEKQGADRRRYIVIQDTIETASR